MGFPCGSVGIESTCNAGDLDSIPGLGRSPGGRHGHPLQYSGLENPMDRGARPAKVHSVAKSRTQVKEFSMHAHVVTRSLGIPGGSDGKESDYNAGDLDSIPGLGISPTEGNSNPLQHSCLENSMD